MRLLRPEMLWIAAAVVPLVILHLRWRRRRRVEVASLTVWHEVVRTGAGRRGLRRLREALSLLASALAVLAIAIAAAEPVSGRDTPPGVARVIVLDASLTMSVGDVSHDGGVATRLDEARRVAVRALAGVGPRDDVTVWVAGSRPRVLIGPTADVALVETALRDVRTTLAPGTLAATVDAARRALTLRGGAGVLLVLTDSPDAVPADAGRPAVVAAFGAPPGAFPGNGALRGLTVDGDSGLLATVSGADARELVASQDGRELVRTPVPRGGDDVVVRVALPPGVSGPVRVELAPPDAFPVDDAQSVFMARPQPLAIVVRAPRGQPSGYLLAALAALPDGLVDRSRALLTDLDAGADVLAAADVVITESGAADAAPRPVPPGVATLTFGSQGPEVADPRLAAASGHPVTRGVTAGPVRAPTARLLMLRPGETALLSCDDGAVAAAGRAGGARHVRVGLLPEQGTFALEGAFPVLVRNALAWLRDFRGLPPAVAAGEPLSLASVVPEGAGTVELRGPGGTRTVRVGPGAPSPVAERDAGGGLLGVHVPGDPAPLAVTAVQWTPRPGTRLERAPGGLDGDAALAALPARVEPSTTRRHAGRFALAAAILALVGGLVLGRGGAPNRPVRVAVREVAAAPRGLRSRRPHSRVP